MLQKDISQMFSDLIKRTSLHSAVAVPLKEQYTQESGLENVVQGSEQVSFSLGLLMASGPEPGK